MYASIVVNSTTTIPTKIIRKNELLTVYLISSTICSKKKKLNHFSCNLPHCRVVVWFPHQKRLSVLLGSRPLVSSSHQEHRAQGPPFCTVAETQHTYFIFIFRITGTCYINSSTQTHTCVPFKYESVSFSRSMSASPKRPFWDEKKDTTEIYTL